MIAHSEVSRHGPFPSHEAAVKAARRKRDTLLEFDADDAEDAAKLAGTAPNPQHQKAYTAIPQRPTAVPWKAGLV